MNKIKLMSHCCLMLIVHTFCQAGNLDNRPMPGTLHIRVKKQLALEIAKRKQVLPVKPCSRVSAVLEKYGTWGVDVLFFPPFQRLFRESNDVPLKFAAVVPGITPVFGLWLVGSEGYREYIKKRTDLVEFKYKVECLQKWLKSQGKSDECAAIAERASWFLEEGYGQAHERLKDEFCDVLEKLSEINALEQGSELLGEKLEHKHRD